MCGTPMAPLSSGKLRIGQRDANEQNGSTAYDTIWRCHRHALDGAPRGQRLLEPTAITIAASGLDGPRRLANASTIAGVQILP